MKLCGTDLHRIAISRGQSRRALFCRPQSQRVATRFSRLHALAMKNAARPGQDVGLYDIEDVLNPRLPRSTPSAYSRRGPQGEQEHVRATPKKVAASYNRTWAELMRRGLDIDVLESPDCGGRLRFVAAIMLSTAVPRILRHLGLPSDPVELAPARAPPELVDAWAC